MEIASGKGKSIQVKVGYFNQFNRYFSIVIVFYLISNKRFLYYQIKIKSNH